MSISSEASKKLSAQLRKLKLEAGNPPEDVRAWRQFLHEVLETYSTATLSSQRPPPKNEGVDDTFLQLGKEQDKLQAIFRAVKEGLCVLSSEHKIEHINPAACRILGYPSKVLEGLDFFERIEKPGTQFRVKGSSLDLRQQLFESVFIRSNGKTFPVQFSISVLQGPLGDEEALVLVFRDITNQKAKEDFLREQSQQASEKNRIKSEFLATMSHEIRTPINGILSLTQLLLYSELNLEQRKDLEALESCAESLRKMISDILDLSKIEAGKLFVDEIDVDPRKLLKKLEIQFGSQADEKSIVTLFEVRPCVPNKVKGDPLRMHQILMNLISNAIKFTGIAGAMMVIVDTVKCTTGASMLRLSVSDTGIGVRKEKQSAIFESFTQADTSTTKEYGGTGLGLSICSSLARLMGGDVSLISREGVGACFRVMLPLRESMVEGVQRVKTTSPIRLRKDSKQKKTKRIKPSEVKLLLAEDNPINQDAIQRILRRQGFQVELAQDGLEALSRVEEGEFDLVLMDLNMPNMDGMEATQKIRDLTVSNRSLPIIALTAQAMKGVEEECIRAGFNAFITKPINYEELFSSIKDLLESQ